MSSGVKGRVYDNSRREAAALETRRAVIDAAHRLFLQNGYGGTSLADVARAAGVSVQTVYGQLGSKRALLKEVIDVAIAGDHEPIAIKDRAEAHAVEAEPDGERKLRMFARMTATIASRYEPVDRVMRSAAAVDPEVEEQLREGEEGRLWGMRGFAAHLEESGVLRPGLDANEAGTRIWAVHGPVLYRQLVVGLGWTEEQYADYLGDLLVGALLPQKPVRGRR